MGICTSSSKSPHQYIIGGLNRKETKGQGKKRPSPRDTGIVGKSDAKESTGAVARNKLEAS